MSSFIHELQNTLGESGKDLGSMNMDEFLKNIWTSEGTESMAPKSDFGVDNNSHLQKQGSLTLSRKTVDEVWRELHKDVNLIKESNLQPQALGEMTLEEFLRKAGVVSENGQTRTNRRLLVDESCFLYQQEVNNLHCVRSSQQQKPQKILPKKDAFGFESSLRLAKKAQMGSDENGVSIFGKIDNPKSLMKESHLGSGVSGVSIYGKTDNATSLVNESQLGNGVSIIGKSDHPTRSNLRPRSPSDSIPNSSLDRSSSPPRYAYGAGGVIGRNVGGSLEKVVERRRKRMIKNRESAARSRARKQAYTLELEAEVAKLKRLNHELQKKQEEIMESHNFQVPEKMKLSGNRRSCLRRTLTGPW